MSALRTSGDQAVALARDERPGLMLLDVMMPIANGFEVLRRVKTDASTAQIPVIMVTVREQEQDMTAAIRDGAHNYVVKPFNFPVLIEHIKDALDQ